MTDIVPYNPLLHLEDSQVAACKIYILKNPITDEVFYVGQTVMDLEERLSGHISQSWDSVKHKEKINYIKNIIDAGSRPTIHEVETLHATCYVDRLAITEREAYWIKYYKGIGCNLLNIAQPKAYEYQGYLSSLKKGETKWHYYYCGKTSTGKSVYDTKRIESDGFKIPPPQRKEQEVCVIEYNPWENERFISKIGYRKSYEDRLCYVPCYKDESPLYYDDDY